jgi:hypothetical protein
MEHPLEMEVLMGKRHSHITQLWPSTSYNWLFLWDSTFYKWGLTNHVPMAKACYASSRFAAAPDKPNLWAEVRRVEDANGNPTGFVVFIIYIGLRNILCT